MQTHPEDPVGCNNRRLIIDSRNLDINGLSCTLLPQACVVGHHCEIVSEGFAVVVDVVNEFMFHLVEKSEKSSDNTETAISHFEQSSCRDTIYENWYELL